MTATDIGLAFRNRIVAGIRRRMNRNKKPEDDVRRLCLYWADYAVRELATVGVRALIQAGSCSWPRLTREQDDGVSDTHFSFTWEPESPTTLSRVRNRLFPEMHVWAAIPDTHEIIDMTTGWFPELALEYQSMDWPGVKPPEYFWGTHEDCPDGVIYMPDKKAIGLALHYLEYL